MASKQKETEQTQLYKENKKEIATTELKKVVNRNEEIKLQKIKG